MSKTPAEKTPSSLLVAALAWLFPGLGYLALGQRARALTVGITITTLFIAGLLIGDLRCLEVPGYGAHGHKIWYWEGVGEKGAIVVFENETPPAPPIPQRWVLIVHPLDEIRAKPWSVAQIMMGPMDVAADYLSLWASRPSSNAANALPRATASHSRVNEIGVLYTAIAGLLNLLTIIDSWYRAEQKAEDAK